MERMEKDRQNLQSETRTEFGQKMKKAEPDVNAEIQRRIVEEYLRAGYGKGPEGEEISVSGVLYKILEKEKVTTFYDAEGNTLFSLENKRLAEMHEHLAEDRNINNRAEESARQEAKKKLEKERKEGKDKEFADPVINHLLKRCEEDEGLAQDVLQGHKTWKKCYEYIRSQAMKQATGGYAAVRDETVYEWAEDYYRKDDKAEEEERARKAAERKKTQKRTAEKSKSTGKEKSKKAEGAVHRKESEPEPLNRKRGGKDVDGQLDMFSMMGM